MKYYLEPVSAALTQTGSAAQGLSGKEARARLKTGGPNKLEEAKKPSLLRRFLEQLKDPMILVLIAAAAISAVTSLLEGSLDADVFIILFVVIVNAVLGVYQENKAEKAIEALQEMARASTKTLRDGKITAVKSEDLVVGDVILLEAGDAVPADARILECASLRMEESALTGESVPVNKTAEALSMPAGSEVPLGDRKNMAYMGSSVAYGRGQAVIVATGMNTEMGRIAAAISQAKEGQTPLQQKLSQLSKILSWVVLVICAGIFALTLVENFFRGVAFQLDTVLSAFLIAVSLAVAAIPEGLAAVVTIVLSIGVTNMSKRNAVIRKLTAVETLGCAQIICSDKTGTLTQNRMTVIKQYGEDETLLATALALCSDAKISKNGKEVFGEPTEAALVRYAWGLRVNKESMARSTPRIGEAPFDSVRKMMTTVHRTPQGIIQYTKGAPDEILNRCATLWRYGKEIPLTAALRAEILEQNKAMAGEALRVLAGAMRRYPSPPSSYAPERLEQNLCFLGLVGMIDPVRPEVKAAIRQCREAGIRPIMITGDHRDTAVAIAKELGILKKPGEAMTGAALSLMSEEEFEAHVEDFSVYARVQPEHKVRIVNAWKKKGKITAMTGDGVNDAPSIKSADIGIGMGLAGTDVTKNVADMVLADDNFASIVSAVEEGRKIYDNIRKAIQFLLASNLSEVLSILAATIGLGALTGGPFTILLPVHLLWINLVTDCFPAVALGMEKAEPDIMRRKPRKATDGIFAGGMGRNILYQGLAVTALTLTAYVMGYHKSVSADGLHNVSITMAFLTLSMCEIFHSYNMRSQYHSIFTLSHHNWYLFAAMLGSLVCTTLVIYVPFLRAAFHLARLTWYEYIEALLLAFAIIPFVELVKSFQRGRKKT